MADAGQVNFVASGMAVRRSYSKNGKSYTSQLYKVNARGAYRKVNRG